MFPISDDNNCRSYPIINTLLIAANILVFIYEVTHAQSLRQFFYLYGSVPSTTVHHFDLMQLGTLFSYMFLHAGIAHILGNLWVLYLFGDNVEDRLGHFKYLLFYLACGVAAALTQILVSVDCARPCVGASGAIAGVLGAYLILFPNVRVRTWITLLWFAWIPAWVIIGGWYLLQCVSTMLPNSGEAIAWYAHIGGFMTGIILLVFLKPKEVMQFAPGLPTEKEQHPYLKGVHAETNWFYAVGTTVFLAFVGYAGFTACTQPAISVSAPAVTNYSSPKLPSTSKQKHARAVHHRK